MRETVSAKASDHGSYGWPRPLVALLARTRPPGTAIPEEEPWPAMPVFATDPLRFRTMLLKSMPLIVGAWPLMRVGAALYPNLNSFVTWSDTIVCRLKTAFDGWSV